ncbi:MAG: tRNA 2-thiouridine(34) synthase MnmA [Synergistaceae bacterium]|jgi:tRNA-specific 2-thiouridylase|nr:tRNA 2-thiouridine(34) synthase MnmA [Synergistaceae bacterium]
MKRNAMIAMSGGVDSSVAAFLMKERGFGCVGVTMKLFSNEDVGIARDDTCCSLKDTDDARGVAYRLGIPHYVFNFSGDFIEQVIRRFAEAYENGLTPNPCVDCNRYIKFERLLLRARELEYSFLATGHYARIQKDGAKGRYLLLKALDDAKDQSYFLYSMTQDQLAHTLFPLGELRKKEVREIASAQGFLNARKRESQDVCFVSGAGEEKGCGYADFIERYRGRPSEEGNFLDPEGRVLGRHKGLVRYTVGQRKGLGIAFARPLYVCGKDPETNTVTLGEDRFLYSKTLFAHSLNWIGVPPGSALRVRARTRYRQAEQWATVERVAEDEMRVEFDEPQRAVAAGQAVVLYDEDRVVGGGTILRERAS